MKKLKVPAVIFFLVFISQTLHAQKTGNELPDVDTTAYISVDKNAVFPGGNDSLLKYLRFNIKYPPIELCNNAGTVWTEFVVEKSGEITQARIKKGFNEYFNTEVLRVIRSMPNWTPARRGSNIVRQKVILPVRIHLQ